jgi:hypothetical protein
MSSYASSACAAHINARHAIVTVATKLLELVVMKEPRFSKATAAQAPGSWMIAEETLG